MGWKSKKEFRLGVGDAVIGIVCRSGRYADSMRDYFGISDSEKPADIRLRLNIIPHEGNIKIPDSLFNYKRVDGKEFVMGDEIVTGYFDSREKEGEINVKEQLTFGLLKRVFEQMLYQAFYSARMVAGMDSFLVHSSGVIYRDSGFLFFGPSTAGKSTVANISRSYHVLNDEICLVESKDDELFLHYTPFNGFFHEKKPGSALLMGIFYLEHGKNNVISDIRESDAVKYFAREIVPPVGLNETINPMTFIGMLDTAGRINKKVRIKKLSFLPDERFWNEIDRLYF